MAQSTSHIKKSCNGPSSLLLSETRLLFISCLTSLVAPTVYLVLERYCALGFSPIYSYVYNFTSELAIPYEFVSNFDGQLIDSSRAHLMNINFAQNGILGLPGHLLLIKATRHGLSLRVRLFRIMAAFLHSVGLILLALFPGGPREEANGNVRWHMVGALFAILFGNVTHATNGYFAPKHFRPVLLTIIMLMGFLGLTVGTLFASLHSWNTKGLWQRATIYPITSADFLTAFILIAELWHPTGGVKED